MKVLITGAGGQVGRALLARIPVGHEAVGVSHRELDIADEQSVTECLQRHRPDVVINTAAYTAVDRAETEPELARKVNADGPLLLATAARDSGVRLIHLSTDFVFDGRSSTAYTPDCPTGPLGVYGNTKLLGEQGVTRTLPRRSVVLRTAWVYAAQVTSNSTNFVLTMLRVMKANGSVRVVSDQIGTPTSARSLGEAIWKLVDMPEVTGIHHWTDAGVASWYDFAVAIAEDGAQAGLLPPGVTVIPIATGDYPTRARRPGFSVLDKRSLWALGFEPVHWRRNLRAVLGEIAHG